MEALIIGGVVLLFVIFLLTKKGKFIDKKDILYPVSKH